MSDPEDKISKVIEAAPEAKRSADRAGKSGAPADVYIEDEQNGGSPYDLSFPPDCPVLPLGIKGDYAYFLDEKRQIRPMKAADLNQGNIVALFGEKQDLLFTYWPRFTMVEKKGRMVRNVTGWRPEQGRQCLYAEAARQGVWEISDRVRGAGGWRDDDGGLVFHCGDILYHNGEAQIPHAIGRHVYPADAPKPRPDLKADGIAAAEELLNLFRAWNWVRPDTDPVLLVGWIIAAMVGGALDWRPLIWITGDRATGKSTLHKIIRSVLGPGGLVASSDASAAGLWQRVGHASLPVALDELEAEQNDTKAQNIIKLARIAASGDQMLRGGANHDSSAFTVRSCFLFSSILIPPRLGQDVSRMAVLQLRELEQGAAQPSIDVKRLAAIGAALRGRIIAQWPRLNDLIETWKIQLAQAGHGGRGGDVFGVLLACYDLMVSNFPPDAETLTLWAQRLDRAILAESADEQSNHEKCVRFLMGQPLDFYRAGEKRTVGGWIIQAAGKDPEFYSEKDKRDANRALGNVGLMVQEKTSKDGRVKRLVLQVSIDHPGLMNIFRDSPWRGMAGATGVWVQAMERIKGTVPDRQRFNGDLNRCRAVPLDEILGGEDGGNVDA